MLIRSMQLMNSYTKIDGKYYKDNPEVQRVRNRLRPIYYKLAGGFGNYYALPKNERQKLIDRAREEYYNGYISSNIPTFRAHRKLPKVQRPRGRRVTIFKPDDPRGFVYIFKDHMKPVNHYKVGASHNPQERLNQANTWGDFESVWESDMVDNCASLEREVHEILSRYKVKGEWFQVDKTFIINKIQELIDVREESVA